MNVKRALIIAAVVTLLVLMATKKNTALANLVRSVKESWSDRAAYYARANGVPERRVLAIITVESRGNETASGPTNDYGLMQLTQAALTDVNRIFGTRYSLTDMLEAEKNLDAGTKFLRHLMNRTGSIDGATVAYNAGYTGWKNGSKAGLAYLEKVRAAEIYV